MTDLVICEVAPRDGFQSLRLIVPTSAKTKLLEMLVAAGFPRIEATSFVSPKAVPQMADAPEVVSTAAAWEGPTEFQALVPNLRGTELAVQAGADALNVVVAASNEMNRRNFRKDTAETLEDISQIYARARDAVDLGVVVGTAFGCPFETVNRYDVRAIVERLIGIGFNRVSLADTVGMAHPRQVSSLVAELVSAHPSVEVGVHLHDTRGLGIANAVAALDAGARTFDASVGGLGGCPFAGPGAAGNVATEDLVGAFEAMGVETGINLEVLLDAALWVEDLLERGLPSRRLAIKRNERQRAQERR